MGDFGKLDSEVVLERRNFHFGQVGGVRRSAITRIDWYFRFAQRRAVIRNRKNDMHKYEIAKLKFYHSRPIAMVVAKYKMFQNKTRNAKW